MVLELIQLGCENTLWYNLDRNISNFKALDGAHHSRPHLVSLVLSSHTDAHASTFLPTVSHSSANRQLVEKWAKDAIMREDSNMVAHQSSEIIYFINFLNVFEWRKCLWGNTDTYLIKLYWGNTVYYTYYTRSNYNADQATEKLHGHNHHSHLTEALKSLRVTLQPSVM